MNVEIAQRLSALRKQAGLSQEALAEQLGVSRQAVSKWERSEFSPDTDNLIALAQLYGVSLDDLLYVDDEMRDDVAFEAQDRAEQRDASTAGAAGEAQAVANPTAADADASAGAGANAATAASAATGAADADSKGPSKVHIGAGGIHVEDGAETVHLSWRDGIHVVDGTKGEEVHVGWNGVHVKSPADGPGDDDVLIDGNDVIINGEHFDSWQDAHEKYGHGHGERGFEKSWMKFPFPLLVIVVYLLLGFWQGAWGMGLFLVFTIPVYYMLGHAIGGKHPAQFVSGVYPIAVVAWFCYMAFVLNQPHPAWVAFLTIPLVEWLVWALSRWWKNRKRAEDQPIDVEAK